MAINGLDHVNIRSGDLPRSIAFYRDVLGMTVTAAPGADDANKAAWIRDSMDRPVVHMASRAMLRGLGPADHGETSDRGGGAIHHVAFQCTDHAAMVARLSAAGAPVTHNDVPEVGLSQIFVRDPDGVLLELNFWKE